MTAKANLRLVEWLEWENACLSKGESLSSNTAPKKANLGNFGT
jgi:hypothetical protein